MLVGVAICYVTLPFKIALFIMVNLSSYLKKVKKTKKKKEMENLVSERIAKEC